MVTFIYNTNMVIKAGESPNINVQRVEVKQAVELRKSKFNERFDNSGRKILEKVVSEPVKVTGNFTALVHIEVPPDAILIHDLVVKDEIGGIISHLTSDNIIVIENLLDTTREVVIHYVLVF